MKEEQKEFKKQLVWFDEYEYGKAHNEAFWKVKYIQDALEYCGEHINVDNIDKKAFMNSGFVSEFLRVIKKENAGKIGLDISASKLANLLDISVAPLLELQSKYDEIKRNVKLVGGIYKEYLDKESFKLYAETEPESVKKFGGKYLVRAGEFKSMQGKWDFTRNVIIEFPTYEKALEWYNSDIYKPLKELRQKGSQGNIIIIKGV